MVLMNDLELEVPCVCPSLAWLKHTASFIPLFLAAASFPPMFCYHPNVIIVDVIGLQLIGHTFSTRLREVARNVCRVEWTP
jgi:hypothetical protein